MTWSYHHSWTSLITLALYIVPHVRDVFDKLRCYVHCGYIAIDKAQEDRILAVIPRLKRKKNVIIIYVNVPIKAIAMDQEPLSHIIR